MSNSKQEGSAPTSKQNPKKTRKNHDYQSLNNDSAQRLESLLKNGKRYNGNSRKNQISINHLLEFQLYRDLPEYHQLHQRNRRNSGNSVARNRKPRLYLHGMRFINVNYKFVVDYRKPYNTQQMDPNVPVDTQDVIRILVPRGNACPICLSEDLVAPRMITSCGHILCLTCLLSLLESEVPIHKKQESKVIVEKYRDCPLCGSIIRKHDVKPVQVDNVDERFEVPKIKDEVVLTLMTRKADLIVPLPRYLESYGDAIDVFPWASQQEPNLSQYLRFFKGDLSYLVSMYEQEKQDILAAHELDKALYQDDGKFVKLAIANINEDIANWSSKFSEEDVPDTHRAHHGPSSSGSTFYYFQTGFKSSTTYVLSPLDVKVLKSSYNQDYSQLPSSIVAKVENIRYEELTADTATTKYKYLSHLPQGTSIGFLECNWSHNEYISPETWDTFKADLEKRTKQSQKRLRMEETNRRRAINEEEKRARDYIERENNGNSEDRSYDHESWMSPASFGSLTISDHREMPMLASGTSQSSPNNSDNGSETDKAPPRMQKTVWGTEIPKSELKLLDGNENDWDAEEMIRRAREEIEKNENPGKPGKKKKKKIVLLSSGSVWS